MSKTIIIDEDKEKEMFDSILESVFYPRADQVIEVEEFLDNNFRPKKLLTLDTNGYPDFDNVVVMVKQGIELKTLTPKELLRMLDDKFHHRIKDDEDRKKFLKQVIRDWYNGKIKNGILSVNKL